MLRVEAEALLHMGRACGWRGYRQCLQGNKKLLKASNVAGRSLVGGHTSPLSKPFPPRSSRDPTAPAWVAGPQWGPHCCCWRWWRQGRRRRCCGTAATRDCWLPEDGRLLASLQVRRRPLGQQAHGCRGPVLVVTARCPPAPGENSPDASL